VNDVDFLFKKPFGMEFSPDLKIEGHGLKVSCHDLRSSLVMRLDEK